MPTAPRAPLPAKGCRMASPVDPCHRAVSRRGQDLPWEIATDTEAIERIKYE